jgi:dipeptidyl aminopeptidase/acylaminoacyl peptidase
MEPSPSAPNAASLRADFNPFDPTGMIAFTGRGVELVSPANGKTISIHPSSDAVMDWADHGFAWSPDGQELAFLHTRQNSFGYLLLADFKTGQIRSLLPEAAIYGQLSWSPDQKILALLNIDSDSTGTLWLLNIESQHLTRFAERVYRRASPEWIDSSHLVFLQEKSSEDLTFALVKQEITDRSPSPYMAEGVSLQAQKFALSPDGRRIAMISPPGVFLIDDNSSSSKPNMLMLAPDANALQWSPDGEFLVVQEGEGEKWLVRPGGISEPEHIQVQGVIGSGQVWSPDSQEIALMVPDDQNTQIAIYSPMTKQVKPIPIQVNFPFEISWNRR